MSTTNVLLVDNDEENTNDFESKSPLVCFYFLIIERNFFLLYR